MKYTLNGKEYVIKPWLIFLWVILLLYGIGKCTDKHQPNSQETFELFGKTRVLYYDENGNVKKSVTTYKDGRPTEVKNFE